MTQQFVRASIVIKADTPEQAERIIQRKLNAWFYEAPTQPPYPNGTLLGYSTTVLDAKVEEAIRTGTQETNRRIDAGKA